MVESLHFCGCWWCLRFCLCVFETLREMADRFFPNDMPDFVAEVPPDEAGSPSERAKTSLAKLLSLPFRALSDTLKSSAMDLKERVLLNLCKIQVSHPKSCLFVGAVCPPRF